MARSVEYKLLIASRQDVKLALESDIIWFAEELNCKNFLNDSHRKDVKNMKSALGVDAKVEMMWEAILIRVKFDPSTLKEFVDILKEKDDKYEKIVAKLDKGSSQDSPANRAILNLDHVQDKIYEGLISEEDFAKASGVLQKYSHKWRAIGQALGFKAHELDSIQGKPLLLSDAPSSYMYDMLSSWQQWAPGDCRGSTSYATLDSLKTAVDKAGLGLTAQEL